MSAKLYLLVPQARLDIYDAALLGSIMGTPRPVRGQWLFGQEIEVEDRCELNEAIETLSRDLTREFGPLIADALLEDLDVREDDMACEIERAREARESVEADYARELEVA